MQNVEKYPLITRKAYGKNGKNSKIFLFSFEKVKTKKICVRKFIEDRKRIYNEIERRLFCKQQILVIVNLVDRAVDLYLELSCRFPQYKIGLIHGRFIPLIRSKLEKEWHDRLGNSEKSNRSEGSILIGTQILEQSLDLDGDFLLTDLAPIDLLFHRFGRLFRHDRIGRNFDAEAWIICPRFEKINSRDDLRLAFGLHAKLYYDYILWRSYRILKQKSSITVPTDQREMIENGYRYSISQDPPWIKEAFESMENKNFEHKQKALAALGNMGWEDIEDDAEKLDNIDIDPIDVIEEEDKPKGATRLQSVPTKQLLLTKSVEQWNDKIVIKFLDNTEIEIGNQSNIKHIIKQIALRQVKVPLSKTLKDFESPEWLKNICYGRAVPITVNQNNQVCLLDGTKTEYLYTEKCGFYKPLKKG